MVMPFSRSRSPESITRSATSACPVKAPDWRSIASTRVVLPWSTCATMATLRRSLRMAEFNGRFLASLLRSRMRSRSILRAVAHRVSAAGCGEHSRSADQEGMAGEHHPDGGRGAGRDQTEADPYDVSLQVPAHLDVAGE